MADTNRVWRLRRRPVGEITDDVLSLETEEAPEPGDGECLFRLKYLSLDPTNRIWMSDMPQYMPPVELDAPMRGVVCGEVLQSNTPAFQEGDIVSGIGHWADYQIGTPQTVSVLGETGPVPLVDAFGTFAVVGPTAYFGLLDVGQPKGGETVVVSGAAGAVGSIVGQIAKIKGCRAVGIAGSDEKCSWIRDDLGFDAAVNYKTADLGPALDEACPDGIDVYFDNVGGSILEACLERMNLYGRIPTCGLISQYNAPEPVPGPVNYPAILMQRLRVQGFIVLDYADRYPEAIRALAGWMAEGRVKIRQDVVDGLENARDAVKRLFNGTNNGKLIVRVSD